MKNYDCINVTMTQKFDFNIFNITTEKEKQEFLQKMCASSINTPITKDEKVIGIITDGVINEDGDGVILNGKIWGNFGYELFKNTNGNFEFSSIVIDLNNKK